MSQYIYDHQTIRHKVEEDHMAVNLNLKQEAVVTRKNNPPYIE